MLNSLLPVVSFVMPLANCGAPADPADASPTAGALPVGQSRFALQFTGTYRNPAPLPGVVQSLTLERDGRYYAEIAGQWWPETGTVQVGPETTLPLTFHLFGGHEPWTATIADYDRVLQVERNGATVALAADGIVGPDETLCDESGGMWTDDDVDRPTGLYCLCPAGEAYLPSEGGCVP